VLTFNLAPDFDVATDANGDGIYEVEVQVSDGIATDTQTIQVTVIEADGTPIGVAVINESVPEPEEIIPPPVVPGVVPPPVEEEGPIEEEAVDELPEDPTGEPVETGPTTEEQTAHNTGIQPDKFDFERPNDLGNRSDKTVPVHVQLRAVLNSAFALNIPAQLLIDPVRLLAEGLDFRDALDNLRENVTDETAQFEVALRSGALLATGLSIGYVAWLAKGGLMAASLVTTLPLWRIFDPIPVLANMDDSEEEPTGESESLASMLEDQQETDKSVANTDTGNEKSSIDAGEAAS
jgi:hypothetical protein